MEAIREKEQEENNSHFSESYIPSLNDALEDIWAERKQQSMSNLALHMHIPYYRELSGNRIVIYIKKAIRKLVKFLVFPITLEQSAHNADILQVLHAQEMEIKRLRGELDRLKEKYEISEKKKNRIVQMLVTVQKGDGIGNMVLKLDELFKAKGYHAAVYAYNIGAGIDSSIAVRISEFTELDKDDLLIYHMCEGHEINEIIKKQPCKKLAIYHNSTPARFFEQYSEYMVEAQNKAVREISAMDMVFDRLIAVSEFNKSDLVKMGYWERDIDVIPSLVDFSDYNREPSRGILEQYKDDGWVNILFVGRIVPNKKQEDIIETFAYYHRNDNPKSRLFLIGSFFTQDYVRALQEKIRELDLQDCIIMPDFSTFEDIIAYYQCADIFLCMSEHEGFCVPLIEAMLFDVPILAYHSSAIPYTLGDAGVLFDDKSPEYTAGLIRDIVGDEKRISAIIKGQRERLKKFDGKKVGRMYLEEIKRLWH